MSTPSHNFLRSAGRILNAGQSRSLLLTGNIHDVFACRIGEEECHVPLLNLLTTTWNLPDYVLITYELNGAIHFVDDSDAGEIRDAWLKWRSGYDSNELAIKRMLATSKSSSDIDGLLHTYDDSMRKAVNNPTLALELLRQMCLCSRTVLNGEKLLSRNILILIEGADMLLPDAPITSLADKDRHRISICHDWFSDPGFVNGGDSVVMMAESRSQLHHRISWLPYLLEVEVPAPGEEQRAHFIKWFKEQLPETDQLKLWSTQDNLGRLTAGLSLHALMQLLKGAAHEKRTLAQEEVIDKVEDFIQSQLGEDIVEFKKPAHSLKDVVGFSRLKQFLENDLMPRMAGSGNEVPAGAAVCGPIGGGKTFIFEARAAELDIVVLVIKNIRSQWFGQTDVIFERLRRVINALSKVLIFMDEADTQLGGVGPDSHETERRLTGKIQAMMSDPQLRGRVIWLLVTARIHLLSPDLRRPGRVGDLIIPTLDPEGEDRLDFIRWTVKSVLKEKLTAKREKQLNEATQEFSAAAFASLRAELKAKAKMAKEKFTFEDVREIMADQIPPAIADTRRYQTLQALVNCTRRSLLPDPKTTDKERRSWETELRELEARGIR
jgi:SpoVK/Ycf46/Vps4 family AAA+-type ATPase